jgi:hypothetical protein
MPANQRVSVAWQIVFTFIPILNIWAFYRVRKLRKYLLYVIVPEIAISAALGGYLFSISNETSFMGTSLSPVYATIEDETKIEPTQFAAPPVLVEAYRPNTFLQIIGWALQGFAIYLVIIWSRQHNKQFDQPTTQTVPSD